MTGLEGLTNVIRAENEGRSINIGYEEAGVSLFADYSLKKNSSEPTGKAGEFSKFSG